MIKYFIAFCIFPFLCFSQVQIGHDINATSAGDGFGSSVSVSDNGNIVAVGAILSTNNGIRSGHVSIYENNNGIWSQIGNDINGSTGGDFSGYRISLSSPGNVIAIGSPFNSINGYFAGQVRIFEYVSGNWIQKGIDIYGSNGNEFGSSVKLSSNGNILAVGARSDNGNGNFTGSVRVFQFINGGWIPLGNNIYGDSFADFSGSSVSMSANGNIVAVGAPNNDDYGTDSGHVRVYQIINNVWTQLGNDINGDFPGDYLGNDISLSSDGSIITIAAQGNDSLGTNTGQVKIYKYQSNSWIQLGNSIVGESYGDESGWSISSSSDGSITAIGAVGNDDSGTDSGHVRIYKNNNGIWTKIGIDIDGEFAGDSSGYSVSLSKSGNIVAVGAPRNDGNGADSGHVRIYDLTALLTTESYNNDDIDLYPNPAENQFSIISNKDIELEKISIYNTLGQLVFKTDNSIIYTSHLSKGQYLVEITSKRGKITKKLLIN